MEFRCLGTRYAGWMCDCANLSTKELGQDDRQQHNPRVNGINFHSGSWDFLEHVIERKMCLGERMTHPINIVKVSFVHLESQHSKWCFGPSFNKDETLVVWKTSLNPDKKFRHKTFIKFWKNEGFLKKIKNYENYSFDEGLILKNVCIEIDEGSRKFWWSFIEDK